jgi:hypothetical protein
MLRAIALLLVVAVPAAGQATAPEAFLGEVPGLPSDGCNATKAQKADYLKRVEGLAKRMDAELARRGKDTKAKRDALIPAAQRQRMADAGLTAAEQEQLKHGTSRQKREIADRLMQRQTNLSFGDLEANKKLTPEARRDWAKAYGRELEAGGGPQGVDLAALQKQGREEQQRHDEQLPLQRAIVAEMQKVDDQLRKIDQDPDARDIRDRQLPPLYARLGELSGISEGPGAGAAQRAAQRGQVEAEIRALEDKYCAMLSPRQLVVLDHHLTAVKAKLPDAARDEQLRAKTIQASTGASGDIAEPGAEGIGLLREYVGRLRSVFRYDIRQDVR